MFVGCECRLSSKGLCESSPIFFDLSGIASIWHRLVGGAVVLARMPLSATYTTRDCCCNVIPSGSQSHSRRRSPPSSAPLPEHYSPALRSADMMSSPCNPDIEAPRSGGLEGLNSSTTSSTATVAGTSSTAASDTPSSPQLASAVQKMYAAALRAYRLKIEQKKRPPRPGAFFVCFMKGMFK